MANKFVGAFDVQSEVIDKIRELKAQGYKEENMHVAARDDEQLSMVESRTNVQLNPTEEKGFMGKFISLLSGEKTARDAFDQLGFDKTESDDYYRQLENGKLLLFVDHDSTRSGQHYTDTPSRTHADSAEEESLQLHEERLRVDKKRVQTGEVNVGKHVVEEEQTIDVPVEREEVYVERRPVNEQISGSKDKEAGLKRKPAYDDSDGVHVPVSEERLEISKKNVVTEEVVIGKRKVHDVETVKETVQREVVDIEENVEPRNKGRKPL